MSEKYSDFDFFKWQGVDFVPGKDANYDSRIKMLEAFQSDREAYRIAQSGVQMQGGVTTPRVWVHASGSAKGRLVGIRRATYALAKRAVARGQTQAFFDYGYNFETAKAIRFDESSYLRLSVEYAPPISRKLCVIFRLPRDYLILEQFERYKVLGISPGRPDDNVLPILIELEDDLPQLARAGGAGMRVEKESDGTTFLRTNSNEVLTDLLAFERAKEAARKAWEVRN